MICINQKKNHKLLETFNNDPYFDITISTATTQLNLVLGYLSIDSEFFEKVVPDTKQINLEHLPQGPTIKVLRALYGEELFAFNVKELGQLYQIIEYLQIKEYKHNIVEYIKSRSQLMDSLQLLEFCYKHQILLPQIKHHHYSSNLSVLSSSKNYLQLSKISQQTLNNLLLDFINIHDPAFADPIINSILENYLGRNDIRPNDYFVKPELEPLQLIWEKYHHSINYLINTQEKIRQSQIFTSNMSVGGFGNSVAAFGNPTMCTTEDPKRSLILTGGPYSLANISFSSEIQQKQKEIQNLQRILQLKNQILNAIQAQIAALKNQPKGSQHQLIDSDNENDESMLEEVKKSKKERDSMLSSEYDVSLIEPAFDQDRRLDQNREVKTMNKLNTRTKKIFN